MKKKGLIISTIVMVVVLIASLTTATYAWFNASSFAAVDQIALNVGAASSVAIGVKSATGADTSQASYVSGSVTYGQNGLWSGENNALGTSVSTGLTMNITAAVGSGVANGYHYTAQSQSDLLDDEYIELDGNSYIWKTDSTAEADLYTYSNGVYTAVDTDTAYSAGTTYYKRDAGTTNQMDYVYDNSHTLLKALGENFQSLNAPEAAIINGYNATNAGETDVLDLQMAINPVKSGIYGTFGVITITPNGGYIGMASAIWADIVVGENTAYGVDLFDLVSNNTHWDTTNAGSYKFYFMIDAVGSEMTANDATVTPFSLRLFISGYDEDCVKSATGTGATIDIQFYGVTKEGNTPVYGDSDTLTNAIAITGFAHA